MHPAPPALALLLLLPSLAVAQQGCGTTRLERALFASAIHEREPAGLLSTGYAAQTDALLFFTEVRGGTGQTLTHSWYYGDQPAARVRLVIGADPWRTWSSKQLGSRREKPWRVVVSDETGCILAERSLEPLESAARDGLAPARALLEAGDLTGARLEAARLREEHPDLAEAVAGFLEEDLALARAQSQVEGDELYLARARLDGILERPGLGADLRQRALALRERARQRSTELNRNMALRLGSWQRTQDLTLNGGQCPDDAVLLASRLAVVPDASHLLVGEPAGTAGGLVIGLLDQRTGQLHRIVLTCRPGSPVPGISPSRH